MSRLAALLLAGCALCWACDKAPQAARSSDRANADQQAERRRIVEFWRVYEQATRLRVAGDVGGALVRYDSALALNPDHGDALYHAGAAAFQLHDFATAQSHWRRLLAVDGSNARAHVQLGVLYSCGLPGAPVDLAQARWQLERALDLNRAETGPQVLLGEIALLQDSLVMAGRHFEATRNTNERSVAAHYFGGYLHWLAGRHAAAQKALEQALVAGGDQRHDPSASAEGQTRRGFRPLLESGIQSPLAPYWQATVQQLPAVDDSTTQAEYERFHRTLGSVQQAFLPSQSKGNDR